MLANFLIGLREGLEAALIVSILIAYLVKTERRHLLGRVWQGVGFAVALSVGFGALLTFGPSKLPEEGEEILAGLLSILAVGLVTWMIFWMATAAKGLSAELRQRVDLAAGAKSWSLAVVAFLAVGREGFETALFLWAATSSVAAGGSPVQPLLGAVLGLTLAIALGWAIYRGALRINLSSFFAWTGSFLVFVAGGVLAYGVHELQESGVLPGEDSRAFDLTGVIDPASVGATLVRGILNLRPAMSWLEVAAWLAYVVPVLTLLVRRMRHQHAAPVPSARTAAQH